MQVPGRFGEIAQHELKNLVVDTAHSLLLCTSQPSGHDKRRTLHVMISNLDDVVSYTLPFIPWRRRRSQPKRLGTTPTCLYTTPSKKQKKKNRAVSDFKDPKQKKAQTWYLLEVLIASLSPFSLLLSHTEGTVLFRRGRK